jgi:hypothetical protein
METHPEKEPLLNKEDKDTYIKIEDIKDISSSQKSKEQVINCQDCLELLCFCCYNYDVTQKEYQSHLELSNRCSIKYDKEDPVHEKLLLEFFEIIKELNSEENEEGGENGENNKNKKSDDINYIIKRFSKKIGFQNDNPREDLNKSGLFSLEFMNYFVNNYKAESKNILKEKDFSFALVCINLIYRINLILYLIDKDKSDSDIYNIYKIERCSRKEIKNFCQHLENDNEKDLMFHIINLCLNYAFEKFKNSNSSNIDIIINGTIQHFKEVLDDVKINEKLIDRLKYELEKLKNVKSSQKVKIN